MPQILEKSLNVPKRFFLILCLFICLPYCWAQDSAPNSIGLTGNYQFGAPTSINRSLGALETFGSDGKGISWDNGFGLGLYLHMPEVFSSRLGYSARAVFISGSGQFTSNNFTVTNAATSQLQVEDFKVFTKYNSVEGEFLTTYSLSSLFYTGLGIFGNFRIKTATLEQNEIISPASALFANQQKIDTIPPGSNITTAKFHFGIPLLIGASFRLSRLIQMNIESFAQIDLQEIISGFPKQSANLGLRLSIGFNTRPMQEQQPPPDISPTVLHPPLMASIHFTTNDPVVRQVRGQAEDTIFRRYLALPSIMYFDEDSIGFPAYQHQSDGRDKFDIAALDSISPVECYNHLLDIIGKRMQGLPNSEMTITSYSIVNEPIELPKARTINIKDYLRKLYGIQDDRFLVRVERTAHPKPYIEFSDNSKLLSPLISEREERSLLIPPIGLPHFISSEAGIKFWSINVMDGSRSVAYFSSEDSLAASQPLSILTLPAANNAETKLIAQLHVLDNTGQSKDVYDSISIIESFLKSTSSPVTQEKFILFSDSSKNSTVWNNVLVEKISSIIGSASTVQLQPLYGSGSATIHTSAGNFLRSLKLGNQSAHQIEIIPLPLLSSTPDRNWKMLDNAVVVTITNVF
jgi:hypothetical protein